MGIIETIFRAKAETASDAYAEYAGKPYRPGSGTEGMAFDDLWCEHCARDAEFRKDWNADPAIGCQIIAGTFFHEKTDPEYPKEWVYDRKGKPCLYRIHD